jgi:hypothetical protein
MDDHCYRGTTELWNPDGQSIQLKFGYDWQMHSALDECILDIEASF